LTADRIHVNDLERGFRGAFGKPSDILDLHPRTILLWALSAGTTFVLYILTIAI
jgi:hypothetical protein